MAEPASTRPPARQPGTASQDGAGQDSVDLEALARCLLELLKHEARIEGERIGRDWDP